MKNASNYRSRCAIKWRERERSRKKIGTDIKTTNLKYKYENCRFIWNNKLLSYAQRIFRALSPSIKSVFFYAVKYKSASTSFHLLTVCIVVFFLLFSHLFVFFSLHLHSSQAKWCCCRWTMLKRCILRHIDVRSVLNCRNCRGVILHSRVNVIHLIEISHIFILLRFSQIKLLRFYTIIILLRIQCWFHSYSTDTNVRNTVRSVFVWVCDSVSDSLFFWRMLE